MYKIISRPNSLMEPYISVVVTAYNRREFIREAVQSALDQIFDKQKYEIIVVKNYLDNKIDKFLQEKDVLNIYTNEKESAPKLRIGIQEAQGDIVSFLDDDDIFLPSKLKEVYDVFRQNTNMAYFKHGVIKTRNVEYVKTHFQVIDLDITEGKNFRVSELNSRKLFLINRKFNLTNSSSISIRKNLYLPFLDVLRTTPMVEIFLFYLAVLMNDQAILSFQNKPLSIWRVHDSQSQYGANITKSEFLERELQYSKDIVAAYEDFIAIITSMYLDIKNVPLLIDTVNTKLGGWYGRIKLSEGKKCSMKNIYSLAKTGIYLRNINILLSTLLGLFSLFVPDFAGKIFNEALWTKNS